MNYLKIILIYLGAASLVFLIVRESDAKSSLRVVRCEESNMIDVFVRPNFGTIINFPVKPDNIVLGGQKQFGIEYIKNDIALTALTSNSNTNLFVYLLGRRCGFRLLTSVAQQDHLVHVRDPDDSKMKVTFK